MRSVRRGRYRTAVAERDLLVLGDVNPDIVVTGDVEPRFGQAEVLVDAAELVIGGSGAITACAAAKLGLRTALVGVVGDDALGRSVLDRVSACGVDTSGCVIAPRRPTGLSIVLSRGDDRAILTFPGAIADLTVDLVEPELIRSARHVHVSSYFLQRGLAGDLPAVFDVAHEAGATTSIDPNWDPAERWDGGLLEVLDRTDLFLPNGTEARAIAHRDDVRSAAEALAVRGVVVVVKLGDGGAFALRGDELVERPAVPSHVIDTTGAGDTFDAGFLAGRLRGWSIERSLALAVVCGSLSTRGSGGTGAQPTWAEALAALDGTA